MPKRKEQQAEPLVLEETGTFEVGNLVPKFRWYKLAEGEAAPEGPVVDGYVLQQATEVCYFVNHTMDRAETIWQAVPVA